MMDFLRSFEPRDWSLIMINLATIIQGLAILRMQRR
jgi:hypothetical protein